MIHNQPKNKQKYPIDNPMILKLIKMTIMNRPVYYNSNKSLHVSN